MRCIEDELPFEIPDSWEWIKLGYISTYEQTKAKIKSSQADPNTWELNLEDIEKGGRLLQKKSVKECKSKGDKTIFHVGDILYSKLRPYLLKIMIADEDGICTSEIVPFRLYGDIYSKYVVYTLKSPFIDGYINSVTYGVKMPRAGTDTMINLYLPLPPLSEQHRIVAKLQELEPLIEKYRIAEEQLHELNSNIKDQLKKSILQYAIEGKLVPQDPNDEPASVLLERIREEKQRLIKEGKIKKDKNESIIFRRDNSYYEKFGNTEFCIDDEIKCSVPINWILTRQKNLCWLNNGNLSKGEILPYLEVKVLRGNKEAETKDSGVIVTRGTNVILVDGENSGEVMKIKYRGYMGSTFKILQTSNFVNEKYVDIIFQCNRIKYKHNKKGAAIPHLDKELFNNTLIFLPPITEQQRILEKINLITHLL